MATVLPKKGFKNATPIDVNEVNEGIEVFVQEMQGNLGEHNWAQDAFIESDVSAGAIMRAYVVTEGVNWFDPGIGSYLEQDLSTTTTTLATDAHKVSNAYEWATIAGMEISLLVGNVILWVTFSAQTDFRSSADTSIGGSVAETYGHGNNLSGLQIGIFINGSLISETTIGSMDRSNDYKGEGHHFKRDPVAIDCVTPVPPGKHTISAKIRIARHHSADRQYDSTTDFYAILSRQLYIVEMR